MFKVKNRSEEAWGPLADHKCSDIQFIQLISSTTGTTKTEIKNYIARQKRLKKYKVTFIRELHSDPIEVMSDSEYGVSNRARDYFLENKENIEFKLKPVPRSNAGNAGYDRISYVKVRE